MVLQITANCLLRVGIKLGLMYMDLCYPNTVILHILQSDEI